MREILFRGKRIDNGEWVEGDLLHNGIDYETAICNRENQTKYVTGVIPETVGQFTGLTANGKKIFEGDIISMRIGRAHIVNFENGAFSLTDTAIPIRYADKFEIIGNIHDNPELLEGKEK